MSLDPQRDADLLAALGELGGPHPGERSDDDLIAGALAGMADPRLAPVPPAEVELVDLRQAEAPSRAPIVIAFAAAGLAIAAAIVLVVLRPGGLLGEKSGDAPGSMAPSVHEDDDDGDVAIERQEEERVKSTRRREAIVPPPATPLDRLDADTDGAAAGETEAADEGSETGETGEVERAGRRAKKPSTPDALLARAQTLFGEGKTDQAVRTYESLIAKHPRSTEAKAARVSLGRIELSRGNADKALRYFDDYLAMSAGSLVQEARYGRVRALRNLGRTDAERRSIEAFLRDYPKSVYAPRLQKRAAELGP